MQPYLIAGEPELTITDLRLIRDAYFSTVNHQAPFLPAFRWFKRGRALAARGLLEETRIPSLGGDWWAFRCTKAGAEAYNKRIGARNQPEIGKNPGLAEPSGENATQE